MVTGFFVQISLCNQFSGSEQSLLKEGIDDEDVSAELIRNMVMRKQQLPGYSISERRLAYSELQLDLEVGNND